MSKVAAVLSRNNRHHAVEKAWVSQIGRRSTPRRESIGRESSRPFSVILAMSNDTRFLVKSCRPISLKRLLKSFASNDDFVVC